MYISKKEKINNFDAKLHRSRHIGIFFPKSSVKEITLKSKIILDTNKLSNVF
jgi:hypothetical protein